VVLSSVDPDIMLFATRYLERRLGNDDH